MAHITASVEYAIHCLLLLVGNEDKPLSSRELAELQGISPSFLSKIFPKLEKAGIVKANEGVRGGYLLAQSAEDISFLSVIDAIEGQKPLFDCQEVRGRCAIFDGTPPEWATSGVCAIHAAMLQAEKAMRDTLSRQTLGEIASRFTKKAPPSFGADVEHWISERMTNRTTRSGRPTLKPATG